MLRPRLVQRALLTWVVYSCLATVVKAEVELVTSDAPQNEVWIGQKAPFYVKVRGKGPFEGATSFSIPHIPQAVIVKVGNPVVSSEEVGDDSWFVQTHEFALFSQADGNVKVPSFEVRFTDHDGFTGPEVDHVEQVPSLTFDVKRPPDSEDLGFLVTTDDMDIEETWDPQPGKAKQGDVFHRTITQQADQVTAMALAPPPTDAPRGVRIYTDEPQLRDETERGDFRGTRSDTLTYLFESPGTLTIPAIKYTWWNPKSKEYGTKTLPAVTIEVTPQPQPPTAVASSNSDVRWSFWLLGILVLSCVVFWQRRQIHARSKSLWQRMNPPEKIAARALLSACRHDTAKAAQAAWLRWLNLQNHSLQINPELQRAITDLQRHLYGPADQAAWKGRHLAQAFRTQVMTKQASRITPRIDLVPLNPH